MQILFILFRYIFYKYIVQVNLSVSEDFLAERLGNTQRT